MAAQ
jgi:hypothetical protein